MNQKNSMRAISVTIKLMFQLKVLIIYKSKNTYNTNISNCTLIVKLFTGFDTLFLANFYRFSELDGRLMC